MAFFKTEAEYQAFRARYRGEKTAPPPAKKPSKWKNVPCKSDDGVSFDSKAERTRYYELTWVERAGKITDLRVHPKFQFDANGDFLYEADFCYYDLEHKQFVVEDIKNVANATASQFRKNCRLMQEHYDITVSIIRKPW